MNENRKAYLEMREAELKELSARIVVLRTAAHKAAAREKLDYYDRLEEARIKENAALQKLDTLKEAKADRWPDLKITVDSAMAALRRVLLPEPVSSC